MADSTNFGIRTAADFLAKAEAELNDLSGDPLNARHALNTAMTLWHMSDWCFAEGVGRAASFSSRPDYEAAIKTACPALVAMYDIAIGAKHCVRERQIDGRVVNDSGERRGGFSRGFDFGFDIHHLWIADASGEQRPFELDAQAAVTFWKQELAAHRHTTPEPGCRE